MIPRTDPLRPPAAQPAAATAARVVPIAMTGEEFRRAGHQLVDAVAAFLDTIRDRPLTTGERPDGIRALIGADVALPDEGGAPERLLGEAAQLLFGHSLFNAHPRFFGYVTSSPAPIGMLAELLAAAVNANVGAWRLAPVATEIEAQTIRWIAELAGYPPGGGGLLVSGGNMANIVALLAARVAVLGEDVRREGIARPAFQGVRIYASPATHTWLQKACDLAGLGTGVVSWIPTDERERMDIGALREAVASDRDRGITPLLVVGNAGTVSTGAVDDLPAISAICREAGAWFHADGAYGGLAAGVPGVPDDLKAIALADSVALDPHKWLYAPLEAGCLLVRDAGALRRAFSYHPPYYHFGQEATNYFDLGPQNSRGFRALKVWLALRQGGRSGYVRMMQDDIRLSQRLHAAVARHPEIEPFTQALSISTFRFVPQDLRPRDESPEVADYLNRLNEELLERIQESGEAFVSNAVLGGRYLLRACIVNFNTTEADVDMLPAIVAAHGREADAALRPGWNP